MNSDDVEALYPAEGHGPSPQSLLIAKHTKSQNSHQSTPRDVSPLPPPLNDTTTDRIFFRLQQHTFLNESDPSNTNQSKEFISQSSVPANFSSGRVQYQVMNPKVGSEIRALERKVHQESVVVPEDKTCCYILIGVVALVLVPLIFIVIVVSVS